MKRPLSVSRGAYTLLCGAMLALLSACGPELSTEQLIEQRATARWDAYFSEDVAQAYEYLSPGYRSSVSFNQYQRELLLMQIKWKDAQYIESDCTETVCKVQISLKYTVYGAIPGVKSYEGAKVIIESWLLTDGNWYLVPEK